MLFVGAQHVLRRVVQFCGDVDEGGIRQLEVPGWRPKLGTSPNVPVRFHACFPGSGHPYCPWPLDVVSAPGFETRIHSELFGRHLGTPIAKQGPNLAIGRMTIKEENHA